MSPAIHCWDTLLDRRLNRRAFLAGALAGVGALTAAACGPATGVPTGQAPVASPPGTPPTGGIPAGSAPSPTAAALAPTITRGATVAASPSPIGRSLTGERRRLTTEGSPPPRRDHSLTLAAETGVLYLFGGRAQGAARADLWAFDVKGSRWREITPAGLQPAQRFGHEAFWDASRGRLVITLGQAGSTFYNDVWAFDPLTTTWREIGGAGDRPATRYGAGGAHDPAGGRFLITRGFTNQGRFDDTWAFDLKSETWSKSPVAGPVPLKRCLGRSAWDAAAGRFFLYGGQSNEAPFLGDHWALGSGAWAELRPAASPGPRNLYGAAFDPGIRRWYLVGGNTPSGRANDAWAFDAAGDEWRPITVGAEVPVARLGLDLTGTNGTLHMFGGNDGTTDLADTWVLRVVPA